MNLLVGLVSISDRASAGVYKDEGIPALKEWLAEAQLVQDRRELIEVEHHRRAGGRSILPADGVEDRGVQFVNEQLWIG